MSVAQSRALIEAGRIGHLGCVADGMPYVVPVCYLLSDDAIYVHSLGGRKVRALRQDPRACLQVEAIVDDYNWRSAIAFGRFEEVTDADERERAVRRLLARFPRLTPVESVPVHDGQSSVIVFCIRIEAITGVCER
ncbi:MAG TPA: pyridoxamine 5'-phosphate oxidase family protein [Blastocatellia bacterium]|nr:pyridoxamine 5'-phosphate oxidase family protein [Blastocatellia bacterium]